MYNKEQTEKIVEILEEEVNYLRENIEIHLESLPVCGNLSDKRIKN